MDQSILDLCPLQGEKYKMSKENERKSMYHLISRLASLMVLESLEKYYFLIRHLVHQVKKTNPETTNPDFFLYSKGHFQGLRYLYC